MEVRLKLHVNKELDIQNVWMSLNYEKNPSISHLINEISRNFKLDLSSVKLYLDDYWLPPWENTRLLRENDCVKVIIGKKMIEDEGKLLKQNDLCFDFTKKTSKSTNIFEKKQNTTNNLATNETVKEDKSNDKIFLFGSTNNFNFSDENNKNASKYQKENNSQKAKNNKYNLNKLPNKQEQEGEVNNNYNKNDEEAYENYDNNYYNEEEEEDEEYNHEYSNKKNNNSKIVNKQQQQPQQKFQQQEKVQSNEIVDKIAQSIYSTGKYKWKNSNKPLVTKQPTHIIFDSTNSASSSSDSSSDSSSSNSSSSESSSESSDKQKNKNKATKTTSSKNTNTANNNAKNNKSPKEQNNIPVEPKTNAKNNKKGQNANGWKPKTKEEQLNVNPKTLNEFKKVFNSSKYVPPIPNTESEELIDDENLFENIDDNTVVEQSKKNDKPEQPSIDYEKLDPLIGAPTVNQKIAFQTLEISNNFTPEISAYKTGTVILFNESTNEIKLKIDGTYNEVLNTPNKFTVVEETDEESANNNEAELSKPEEPEELTFDWKDLMNVKIIPINE